MREANKILSSIDFSDMDDEINEVSMKFFKYWILESLKDEEWTKKYYDNNNNLQTKTIWVASNETKYIKAYTVARIWTNAITGDTVKITMVDGTPEDKKNLRLYTAQDVKKWNLPTYGENPIQEEQDFYNNPNSC